MIYGKYSFYIFLSYGAAGLLFAGLAYRVNQALNRAKSLCRAALSERPDASSS